MCDKSLLSFFILSSIDESDKNEPERAYKICEQEDNDNKSEYPVSKHH